MKRVATSIGTKVRYAFEKTAGQRPTALSDYKLWEDCTSHPDFNPEHEQIETTTLVQEKNKTYTNGLKDLGVLEFGFNLTQEVLDSFLEEGTGICDMADKNIEQGLRMWVSVDIKYLNKTYFVPVEPQRFGLPGGQTNSKYELVVRFNPIGDGDWYPDLTEDTATTNEQTT